MSRLGHPFAMRSRVSLSQACGSTPFNLQVYAERRTMPNGHVFSNIYRDLAAAASA
jgi:hypothetical protein